MDILNLLFQYNLLHLYTPIINNVGFSHPLTFTIVTVHNVFSLTYLLFTVAVAYPFLYEKTWLIPTVVTTVWTMISISTIITLNIPIRTAIAAVLPHGLLEFAAIVYWTNAMRKAMQNNNLPKLIDAPTLRDYLRTLTKPNKFISLAKKDAQVSSKAIKLSFKTLCKSLKRAYLITLILIAIAGLIETYITPNIVFLTDNL